jgi:DNA-binding transcriptional LysR family regulator
MTRVPRTTVEQWSILRTVVELGGYAQAAEQLNRSQSSISYAIANLQRAAGVQIVRLEGRRTILTEAGHALLAEAAPLIDDFLRIEQRARAVAGGERIAIRLAVDSLYPKPRLIGALRRLSRRHPHVELYLREAIRLPMPDAHDRSFDLAIAQPIPGARYGRRVADIELVAVVAASHPLAQRAGPISAATLARHLRIEIRDLDSRAGPAAPVGGKAWHLGTVEAVLGVVREGLGYSWLPRHVIAADLARGDLVVLPLAEGGSRYIPLDLCVADRDAASDAVILLADALAA